MNKKVKKIVLSVILVLFIGIIVFCIININNKAVEKSGNSTNTAVASNTVVTNSATTSTNTVNTDSATALINTVHTQVATTTSTTSTGGSTKKYRAKTADVSADTSNMKEITDSFFIEAVNDVYYNIDDYLGKTIKMEGLIYEYAANDSNDICVAVVRQTPGCCGNDGLSGLDIRYDGEYPAENTWVTVVGVIGTDTVYGETIPVIQVTSLEQTEVGTTFVSN